MYRSKFIIGEYYHVYNRGVEKRDVFSVDSDYVRFLKSMWEFNDTNPAWKLKALTEAKPRVTRGFASDELGEPYVEIIAYCLNNNHFHFILKQLRENGISDYMQKLGTGYTMYFNKRYAHSGTLFQGVFKSVHIDSNEYLLHVSAYVNCNSEVHGIADSEEYQWCSFPDYIGKRNGMLPSKDIVLGQFRSAGEYREFAKINAIAMKTKKELAKLTIE